MGINTSQVTSVPADQFKLIVQGNDYFPDGMFLRNVQNGEISQYSGGTFHLVSVPVATKLGLTANDVVTITADQYNKVVKGNDYFPEGMLIRNYQTGEVDIYGGGQRHWISVPVATRMNLTASQLTTISASQFNAIPQGNDYFPDGVYLQNQVTGEISQYSGGMNHLVSAPVASAMGLTPAQLVSVAPSQYNAIQKGSDYFPEGMFLQNDQSGEVDQYSGGHRHWVSSAQAVLAGLTPSQVTIIGANQFNAIPRGNDFVAPVPPQPATSGNSNA
jgi:hypothetical protein